MEQVPAWPAFRGEASAVLAQWGPDAEQLLAVSRDVPSLRVSGGHSDSWQREGRVERLHVSEFRGEAEPRLPPSRSVAPAESVVLTFS